MRNQASLVVIRIMPKDQESDFDPSDLFEKFCVREEDFTFAEKDIENIKCLFLDKNYRGDNNRTAVPLSGERTFHYVAMIQQDSKSNVERIGIAKAKLVWVPGSNHGSNFGITPLEKPQVLKNDDWCKRAFAHLKNVIAFDPEPPSERGFASVIEAPSIVNAVALLLTNREKALATQGAFQASTTCSSSQNSNPHPYAQGSIDRLPLFVEDERESEDGVEADSTDTFTNDDEVSGFWDARNGFQLDFDRVIHAKSYRRLVDKAQVYGAEKGDHFRTRMTHTQVVMQIARSIAEQLNANELLTSAIALAHDLGHTPFGHEGERALEAKLDEKSRDIGFYLGGFKHNFQSVRVLSSLEETHAGFVGSNVSWQVLEGSLWHTKVSDKHKNDATNALGTLKCTFNQMDPLYFANRAYFDKRVFHAAENSIIETAHSHSLTVEGQIVAIADEIAQRSHDLDDAISAGLISVDDLWKLLDHFSYQHFGKTIELIKNQIQAEQDEGRLFVNAEDVLRNRLSSIIIRHLIKDVCEHSAMSLEGVKLNAESMVDTETVNFSKSGRALNEYLESIVKSRVLASTEVARFDGRGSRIVTQLFDAYYNNPKTLPASALRRFIIMEKAMGCFDVIDLSEATPSIASDEFTAITTKGRIEPSLLPPEKSNGEADPDKEKRRCWRQFAKKSVEMMGYLYDHPEKLKRGNNSYLVKHVFLMRVIADHIAGMTDSYATAEYHRLIVR